MEFFVFLMVLSLVGSSSSCILGCESDEWCDEGIICQTCESICIYADTWGSDERCATECPNWSENQCSTDQHKCSCPAGVTRAFKICVQPSDAYLCTGLCDERRKEHIAILRKQVEMIDHPNPKNDRNREMLFNILCSQRRDGGRPRCILKVAAKQPRY